MLNDIRTSMDTFEQEANYNAYKEILERLKENKNIIEEHLLRN